MSAKIKHNKLNHINIKKKYILYIIFIQKIGLFSHRFARRHRFGFPRHAPLFISKMFKSTVERPPRVNTATVHGRRSRVLCAKPTRKYAIFEFWRAPTRRFRARKTPVVIGRFHGLRITVMVGICIRK